ncbi:putative ubiquitination network signaling protein acrB [Bienertia sinuspersici]
MGMCCSSNRGIKYAWENDPKMFIEKMKLLQQEINGILKQREEEAEVYERELMVLAFRETEWKKERKKLREEVERLQRIVEEKEERITRMEEEVGIARKNNEKLIMEEQCYYYYYLADTDTDSHNINGGAATLLRMEQMRLERARRDETVEKWKMLYLAIKHELDALIHRTHQGTLYWRAEEEDLMEDLQSELKAKDETIQVLKAQLASMEDEEYKSKREVDILRQSLRIMSSNSKGSTSPAQVKSHSKHRIHFTKNLSKLAFV